MEIRSLSHAKLHARVHSSVTLFVSGLKNEFRCTVYHEEKSCSLTWDADGPSGGVEAYDNLAVADDRSDRASYTTILSWCGHPPPRVADKLVSNHEQSFGPRFEHEIVETNYKFVRGA